MRVLPYPTIASVRDKSLVQCSGLHEDWTALVQIFGRTNGAFTRAVRTTRMQKLQRSAILTLDVDVFRLPSVPLDAPSPLPASPPRLSLILGVLPRRAPVVHLGELVHPLKRARSFRIFRLQVGTSTIAAASNSVREEHQRQTGQLVASGVMLNSASLHMTVACVAGHVVF